MSQKSVFITIKDKSVWGNNRISKVERTLKVIELVLTTGALVSTIAL